MTDKQAPSIATLSPKLTLEAKIEASIINSQPCSFGIISAINPLDTIPVNICVFLVNLRCKDNPNDCTGLFT